jgi:hypothetical protein
MKFEKEAINMISKYFKAVMVYFVIAANVLQYEMVGFSECVCIHR